MSRSLLPGELMEFFIDNRQRFNNEALCIAEDDLTGMEVWITEKGGYPYFSVCCDGYELHCVECVSGADAISAYRDILEDFINDEDEPVEEKTSTSTELEDDEDSLLDDEQYCRNDQIYCSVMDMLDVMLDNCTEELGIEPGDIEQIAFTVEKKLHDDYGIAVQHPVVLVDKDGNEYVEEYPWDPDWQEKE